MRTLPGARVLTWKEQSRKLKRDGRAPVARAGVRDAVLAYATKMPHGSARPLAEVQQKIGASAHGTWYRALRDPDLRELLSDLGAVVTPASGRRPGMLVRLAVDGTYSYRSGSREYTLTEAGWSEPVRRA
jgi:hypothetical protein